MFKTLLSAFLVVSSLTAWADRGPISPNPDDYDIIKYQRLLEESSVRLRNAQDLLASLNARVDETGARMNREQAELAEVIQAIEANNQALANADARLQQLQQSIVTADAEMRQLQQGDIPNTERQFVEQSRFSQALQNQLAGAEQNAANLEAVARDKASQAQALAQNAEQKRQALAQTQAQFNDVRGRLEAVEAQRAGLQRRIDDLRVRADQLARQLQAARDTAAVLERETTQKQQAWQQSDAAAKQAEAEATAAEQRRDPNAPRLRRRATLARNRANELQREYAQSARSLEAARAEVLSLDNNLGNVRSEQAESQRQFSATDQQVISLREQVNALVPRVRELEREAREAQMIAQATANDAAVAQNNAAQARATAVNMRNALAESQRKTADLENTLNALRARVTNLQNAIAGWANESEAQRRAIGETRERNRVLGMRAEERRRRFEAARAEYSIAVRDRDQAAMIVEQDQREVAAFRQRFEEVRANLANAVQIALADGHDDGAYDGAREGARQGALLGERQGLEIGEREGRAQGMREGVARVRSEGTAQGQEVGRTEGNEKGANDGRTRGEAEGKDQGNAKGLQEGYDAGKSEGYAESYPKGEAEGHAMGGVAQGRSEGYAEGKARAESEGNAKGRVEGTRKGHDEFNNANLVDVTVSNRAAAAGVQSANFDRPQWDNYNPRRQYPHPEIQRAYNDSYQQNFYGSAADSYDRTYPATYERFKAQAFESNRQAYANRDYPEERKAAYDAAYAAAFDAASRAAADVAYRAAYTPAFEAARQAGLPVRHDEGRNDGLREGFDRGKTTAYNSDLEQGRKTGRQAGWDENYQRFYDAAMAKAYGEVVQYFSTNAVLKFDGAVTADANNDGVYAPGESVTLTVAVKNYGKVAQGSPVTVTLSDPSANLVLDRPTDTLVPLAGQSRSVVTEVAGFRIAPAAEAGKTETLTVTVSQGDKTLGQVSLNVTVGYPYSVASVERPDYPTAGQDNKVSVKIRNGSSKPSSNDVLVKLVSLDGLSTVTGAAQSLSKLLAGETKAAELAFAFSEENAYKTLSFEVQVYEGTWLLGKQRFSVDASKRWNYNADSAGLLVLNTSDLAKRAEAASKLAGQNFDLWDVRVEGQLTADAVLKYLDKSVVIPSVNGQLGDATAAAIKAYLDRGGLVYDGMIDEARRTGVGLVLTNAEQSVSSSLRLGDDLVAYQANFFSGNEPKFAIVEGRDIRMETATQIARDLTAFALVRKSFTDKVASFLTAVNSGNQDSVETTQSVVLYDLVKEMRDNVAIKGDRFKKHRAELRLTAFINTALSKAGQERRAMLMLTPALDQTRKEIESDGWFSSTPIKDTLKPLLKAYDREILGRKGS